VSPQEITQELGSIRRNSAEALEALTQASKHSTEAERVCWHCRSLSPVSEEESAGYYDLIGRSLPQFLPPMELTSIAFGSYELWEKAFPTMSWLTERLEQFQAFAEHTGSCPEGWSYEPTDRSAGNIPQAWADEEESAN
jgi:hypothetical protein